MRASSSVLSLLGALSLAACAAEIAEAGSDPSCMPDVELGTEPRRIAVNGVQVNGVQRNDRAINGVQLSGVQLNGVQLNGVQTNGVQSNGIQNTGVTLALRAEGAELGATGLAANELVALTTDGQRLAGDGFVGATLRATREDGSAFELVVRGFERTTAPATAALYDLTYEGRAICAEGKLGMFVPGAWDERGARRDASGAISFSCVDGAIAKCVLWGYAPWTAGADAHQACTRMVRADYCGTGVAHTKEGTAVDVFDTLGIQRPTGDADFAFEAGWGPDGATCVNRPRFDARGAAGDELLPACWRSLPACSSLDEATARGAMLANASRPQSQRVCGR